MRITGHTYEKPSRISQALVVCFSIAVVLMAGWFAITIMFSHYGTTSAVDDTDIVTTAPIYVENVSAEPEESSVTARLNSAYFEPLSRDYAYAAVAPPRSALRLAPVAGPFPAATHDPGYAALSIATVVPDANYRGIPADEPLPAVPPIEATNATADLAPLRPSPKPARKASIPVPRPRPQLEAEDVQPAPEQPQSLFDLLMYGQR
jgi:hypothetical protein